MMKSSNNFPLGFFDSGIGGTSIWNEVANLLPNENTIYLSDSANAPYGNKSTDEIIDLAIKNTEFLLNNNAKIIIVACNTATTNAIKILREKYAIPFIGIEPAIKPASIQTKTKCIGILATRGTLNSELFENTTNKIDKNITIIEQIGTGLVELIEEGKIASKEMQILLKKHLNPFKENNVDYLVLGCTHYPYLIPQIKTILGKQVHIIDSGEAVAKQTKHILLQHDLINSSASKKTSHQFYCNKNSVILTLESILITKSNVAKNIYIQKKDF